MKYRLWGSFTLAVLFLLIGLLPVYAQTPGRIEGHITNLTIGGPPAEPLPSVEVLVNEWMVLRSGRDGEWNITGLKPGIYTVRLNLPPGYSPAQNVLTATIWGENVETVDLAFYQGEAPAPAVTASTVLTDDRVTVLGQPAPTAAPVSTSVPTAITSTAAMTQSAVLTAAAALPGRAGQGLPVSRLHPVALGCFWAAGLILLIYTGWRLTVTGAKK